MLDTDCGYGANELIYTKDNHETFLTCTKAEFRVITEPEKITAVIKPELKETGAEIIQTVTVYEHEKRIDFDNRLLHVKDMVNKNRYYRYLYIAFPFAVENAKRYCHLNGKVAEYAKDVTGHGTDVYMAARSWCAAENESFGVACFSLDSTLVEFDRIHADKTDFADTGDGSAMFMYVANDWLQMHIPGGSHLDYRFRYSVHSYEGNYKSAEISAMSERLESPLYTAEIAPQNGTLNETTQSFFEIDKALGFLCLKPADDGKGLIFRLYGEAADVNIKSSVLKAFDAERNTVDEKEFTDGKSNFITYRLGKNEISVSVCRENTPVSDGRPLPVGSVYTGLITAPMAACGENDGQLYLLWGQSTGENLSHYKLYRSETPGFEATDKAFVCNVYPEKYRISRYEDTNLKTHTCYYYRVCAVDKNGVCGELSKEFSAWTKEI